jgi:hypothetical protein
MRKNITLALLLCIGTGYDADAMQQQQQLGQPRQGGQPGPGQQHQQGLGHQAALPHQPGFGQQHQQGPTQPYHQGSGQPGFAPEHEQVGMEGMPGEHQGSPCDDRTSQHSCIQSHYAQQLTDYGLDADRVINANHKIQLEAMQKFFQTLQANAAQTLPIEEVVVLNHWCPATPATQHAQQMPQAQPQGDPTHSHNHTLSRQRLASCLQSRAWQTKITQEIHSPHGHQGLQGAAEGLASPGLNFPGQGQ